METKGRYYITTAIAYASAKPHIGNTYEIVLADAIARYKRLEGYDVFFQTGTDANWIFIFNWNGSLIRKISVPMVGESENLFIRGDKLICAFNDQEHNELAIYEAALSEKI